MSLSIILMFIGINEVIFFLQEYYSFAHCIGGGCASIATSFIFTPSERIKQQMQVRSQYRNCWYASVFGIIITFLDIELLALSMPCLYAFVVNCIYSLYISVSALYV